MANENNNPVGLQTEFNYAIDILRLIGWNWRIVKTSRISQDYVAMKSALDNIRLDIQLYIKELGKEFESKFYDHLYNVDKFLNIYLYLKEQLQEKKDIETRNALHHITIQLIQGLEKYELLIKEVIHFKKMDMPEKEDITMAVLED
jgi:hypothetical protein